MKTLVILAFGYLALQLGVWVSLLRELSRLTVAVRRLTSANTSSSKLPTLLAQHSWFRWVETTFPFGQPSVGDLTREDAFEEFDRCLADDWRYTILQRLGISAPILGVVITALGFWTFEPPEKLNSLTEILHAVIPLIAGVGIGAFLALINQALMWSVENCMGRLRTTARFWFDDSILKNTITAQHAGFSSTAATLAGVASSLQETSRQQKEGTHAIQAVAGLMEKTAREFGANLTTFVTELQGLPQYLPQLGHAVRDTVKNLHTILPETVKVADSFAKSVDAFSKTVDDTLSRVALHQQAAAMDLASLTRELHTAMSELQAGTSSIGPSIVALGTSAATFRETLESCLAPQAEFVHDAVARIDLTTTELAAQLTSLNSQLGHVVAHVSTAGETFQSLGVSSVAFRKIVEEQLGPAALQLHGTADSLISAVETTSQAASNLEQSTNRLATASEGQFDAANKLQTSIKASVIPAHTLLERACRHFDSTAETLTEHLDRFQKSLQLTTTSTGDVLSLARHTADGLQSIVGTFHEAIQSLFVPAAHQQAASCETFVSASKRLESSLAPIEQASSTFAESIKRHAAVQREAINQLDLVRSAVDDLHHGTSELHASISEQTIPGQKAFLATVESFRTSAVTLAQFISDGITPAMRQLGELEQLLQQIRATLDTIRPLSSNGKDAARLLDAMGQLTRASDAISTLPTHIRAVLNESTSSKPNEHSSKSSWWRRFRGVK